VIVSAAKRDLAGHAADERLFHSPIFAGVALAKLSGEGCVQDMRRVLDGAAKLKKLVRKYARVPAFLLRCTASNDADNPPTE
jgi:hypothetical protein